MILAWALFIVYLIGTSYLGWLGYKKTVDDFSSFAIGRGDLSPFVVGVTLATSTASAATFIINPGFVYVDGLSAFLHLGISVFLGIVTMLLLLSFSFRRQGEQMSALTIPDWIGKRYGSANFSLYFALVNLLGFAFIVLIVGGISIVMQSFLGVNNVTALLITLIFVTTYVMYGGTYAHVYTNMLQGYLMIGVSILIIGSGIYVMMSDQYDVVGSISSYSSHMMDVVNRDSKLFNTHFGVYISGFLIGAALVCQPHILTKALYVKTDRDVSRYIGVFSVVYVLFTALLLVGFWAHAVVPAEALLDADSEAFRQDLVMTAYLREMFPDWVFSIVSVVLLAAAMSTLDGLLVGMSTITSNDLILNIVKRKNPNQSNHVYMKMATRWSHVVLVILAVLTFLVNLDPPKLLGIFGQVGVYGLVLAAVPPLINGVLYQNHATQRVWILSVIGIVTHFLLYFYGQAWFPDSALSFSNPGVTASIGLLVSVVPTLILGRVVR